MYLEVYSEEIGVLICLGQGEVYFFMSPSPYYNREDLFPCKGDRAAFS